MIVSDDFESGMDRWQPTDPDPADSVWQITEAEVEPGQTGNHVLRVTGMSKYQPPFRSPHSIAWLKDVKVGDFELTARVQNTNPSGGDHRDLCIFWGRQSPSEFYYVHFGAKADPHACQIFIVNNDKRTKITKDEADRHALVRRLAHRQSQTKRRRRHHGSLFRRHGQAAHDRPGHHLRRRRDWPRNLRR